MSPRSFDSSHTICIANNQPYREWILPFAPEMNFDNEVSAAIVCPFVAAALSPFVFVRRECAGQFSVDASVLQLLFERKLPFSGTSHSSLFFLHAVCFSANERRMETKRRREKTHSENGTGCDVPVVTNYIIILNMVSLHIRVVAIVLKTIYRINSFANYYYYYCPDTNCFFSFPIYIWSSFASMRGHVLCRKTTTGTTLTPDYIRYSCVANTHRFFLCIGWGDESRRLRRSNDHFLNKYKIYVTW